LTIPNGPHFLGDGFPGARSADLTSDGTIEIIYNFDAPTADLPEPATTGLFGIAFAALVVRRALRAKLRDFARDHGIVV
jgi:hypothetical protein